MLNGNVLKNFIKPKAEPYQFPEDLGPDTAPATPKESEEDLLESLQDELFLDGRPRGADAAGGEVPQGGRGESRGTNPVGFAQIQADAILAEARAEAERILQEAREESQAQAQQLRQEAQQEGYRDGYAAGMASAAQDLEVQREEQARQMEEQVKTFLETLSGKQEAMMDEAKEDMRDLAIAVAEKVVRISLKSSSGIIAKMIQDATAKMKRREWVHIYVAGCDAKGLAQITPRLTRALSGVSDHIRIIPMAEEESGTCIIETPDTILDASASTQLSNIRTMVAELPPDDMPPTRMGRRISDQ